MNFPEFFEVLTSRYSVFPASYTGESLPDELIEQILQAAHSAPTHGKTQPWRFFVFAREGRKKFAQMQAEYYQSHTPAEQFSQAKYQKLLKNPLKASHIIAIGMEPQGDKIPEIEEILAVACAVQNMALCVHAYGAGGYWSSGGFTYEPQAPLWFGMTEKSKILGFFYIGVPKESLKPTWDRGLVADKVSWIRE